MESELAIDPEVPICDAHHHLWTHRGNYLAEEFLQDADGHNVVSSVFVACEAMYRTTGPIELRPVGETEFVEKVANAAQARGSTMRVAAGIVGFADLMLGAEVSRVIEAHQEASPTRFRGIRHTLTWDPSPEIRTSAPYPGPDQMKHPKFREGFACLRKANLVFDAWLFHSQLPEFMSLAKAFPDVPIVLNHVGLPLGIGPYAGKRDEVFTVWKRQMADIANCQNVSVKLGGLGMPRAGFAWDTRSSPPDSRELADATSPYYLTCIEQFGTDRCMFESNFPVDKISYSYSVLWNSFKRLTNECSATERAALFHGTATRVYQLEPSGGALAT